MRINSKGWNQLLPFCNGSLCFYCTADVNDTNAKGYGYIIPHEKTQYGTFREAAFPLEWKPLHEFEATLTYYKTDRGRSAVTYYFFDEEGHSYPMFMKDMHELLLAHTLEKGAVHAKWTFCKRGANYGVKLA